MPMDQNKRKKLDSKSKLGALKRLFGGMLGGAADNLQGRTRDKKGNLKKTPRQRMLDSL